MLKINLEATKRLGDKLLKNSWVPGFQIQNYYFFRLTRRSCMMNRSLGLCFERVLNPFAS